MKKILGVEEQCLKAINWFFDNESEGIILEDDCIPNEEFIPYCSKLLKKYKKTIKFGILVVQISNKTELSEEMEVII